MSVVSDAGPRKAIEIAATIIYAALLVIMLLSPLEQLSHPRGRYLSERTTVADFLINVAVFLPLGLGLGRCGGRACLDRQRLIVAIAVAAFVFSFAIETLQYLLLPMRYSSIVDVAGDTIGAALGAWWASRG